MHHSQVQDLLSTPPTEKIQCDLFMKEIEGGE